MPFNSTILMNLDGMTAVLFLVWTTLVCLGHAIVFPSQEQEDSGRVSSGTITNMEGWEFTVSIQEKSFSNDRIGVGLLISTKNTLTTCGCVKSIFEDEFGFEGPGINETRVVAGTVDVTQMSAGSWRSVSNVIMHPHCSNQSIYYKLAGNMFDYGIVQVNESFDFSRPQMTRLRLPTWDPSKFEGLILEELLLKSTCEVAGWGNTVIIFPEKYDHPSNILLKTQVQLEDWDRCAENTCTKEEPQCFSAVLLTGKLCANPIGNGNPCRGDIGAPLICNGYVIAIFSELKSCGEYNEPNYYARLDVALPWISQFADQQNEGTFHKSSFSRISSGVFLIVLVRLYIKS